MVDRLSPVTREDDLADMEPDVFGDYVEYNDYEQVLFELEDMRDKYGTLVAKLGDIYREA